MPHLGSVFGSSETATRPHSCMVLDTAGEGRVRGDQARITEMMLQGGCGSMAAAALSRSLLAAAVLERGCAEQECGAQGGVEEGWKVGREV